MSLYPAHTQTNLEFEVDYGLEPFPEPAYTEIETTENLSNFRNYVFQAQTSQYWKTVSFDDFVLPAQGKSKEYCKKWISFGCDNVRQHPKGLHYAQHELKSCKTSNCPLCFVDWINRQANRSTRRAVKYAEDKQFSFRHIILSPPPQVASSMSYAALKKWLTTVMKIANIKTSMVVFHPFRFQDKEKSMPYVSPHFHLLVYGKVTNTTELYNKTQWLIKNKGDLKNDKSIFNCVRYLLSHAGVKKNTHSVRYLGDISYRKLKLEKEPSTHHCPYCQLPLMVFRIIKSPKSDPPPIDHIGLWDKTCFERVTISLMDNEPRIPFYSLDLSGKCIETPLYSFEEILQVKSKQKVVFDKIREINEVRYVTALSSHTIDSFCMP